MIKKKESKKPVPFGEKLLHADRFFALQIWKKLLADGSADERKERKKVFLIKFRKCRRIVSLKSEKIFINQNTG